MVNFCFSLFLFYFNSLYIYKWTIFKVDEIKLKIVI
ncbi:hypothetical protein BB2000_1231 [Proteus mirabilis BB2000]|nr:hypothetical protein BB2000_1231 [Proteus mirabilis BB2000]